MKTKETMVHDTFISLLFAIVPLGSSLDGSILYSIATA
jgi:hypothetical protein